MAAGGEQLPGVGQQGMTGAGTPDGRVDVQSLISASSAAAGLPWSEIQSSDASLSTVPACAGPSTAQAPTILVEFSATKVRHLVCPGEPPTSPGVRRDPGPEAGRPR